MFFHGHCEVERVVLREENGYSRTLCHLVTDLQTMHIQEVNMAVALAGLLMSCGTKSLPGPADLTPFAVFVYNILDHITVTRPFLPTDLFLFIYFKVVRA